jgi:hypothetical protein
MKNSICVRVGQFAKILLSLIMCLTFWQCSREVASIESKPTILAPHEVSLDDAVLVAEKYALSANVSSKGAKAAGVTADSKETIKDENNKALFHIINYTGGGFAIISADVRAMPILAYSLSGDPFPTQEAATVNGLGLWFKEAKAQMKDVVKSASSADSIVIKEWKKYLTGNLNLPKGGRMATNTNCQEWYTTGQYMCRNSTYFSSNSANPNVPGPLFSYANPENPSGLRWGQSRIANANAPDAGAIACTSSSNESFCGRYPAGCGPVAMAQVLWHFKPNGPYDYWSMPNSSFSSACTFTQPGELALAALMRACGDAAGSIYGFLGSCNTLTYPSSIPSALQNLGLSSGGSLSSYSPSTVMNDLYQRNPVILIGTNSDPTFTGFDQHIWVCDGFDEHRYSEYNCDTHQCDEWSYLYLFNNWGFDGRGNGWYATGDFRPNFPGVGNYNQNVRMISGIRR